MEHFWNTLTLYICKVLFSIYNYIWVVVSNIENFLIKFMKYFMWMIWFGWTESRANYSMIIILISDKHSSDKFEETNILKIQLEQIKCLLSRMNKWFPIIHHTHQCLKSSAINLYKHKLSCLIPHLINLSLFFWLLFIFARNSSVYFAFFKKKTVVWTSRKEKYWKWYPQSKTILDELPFYLFSHFLLIKLANLSAQN